MPAHPFPVLPLLSAEPASVTKPLLAQLRSALPNEQIGFIESFSRSQLAGVNVAITANPDAEMFQNLPALQWIQSLWAGVENLTEVAMHNKFEVVRLIDPELAQAMAEAALAWTLYLHRQMPEYAALQREGVWQQLSWRRAGACRVSILGLGELGSACANRLAANGFNVAGWSRTQKGLADVECYQGTKGLHQVLERADILLVLLPLTQATRGLINQQALSLMPVGSALINFARGPIVDTQALLGALTSGDLSHAVLDVFDTEPLPASSPFWQHPKITVLPHIAAPTDPESAVEIAARHIREFRHSGDLPQTVDLQKGF